MTQDWINQKVLIIGAARQGLAVARFLVARGAHVTLNDQRDAARLAGAIQSLPASSHLRWETGGHPLSLLDEANLVCISGGVPLTLPIIAEAVRRNIPLTNDSQIFFETVRAPVVGITGSAGKTTTTTLVGRMADAFAHAAGRKIWIGGNIGRPLVEYVDEIDKNDLVVVELSSFQLEQMTISPRVGAILNITPNHLDRHGTLEAYTAAKARLLAFQSAGDTAVLNRDDPGSWALRSNVRGHLISFGKCPPQPGEAGAYLRHDMIYFNDGARDLPIMPVSLISLRGEHNRLSVLAACAIAMAAGLPVEAMRAGVEGFNGVVHRLEYIGKYRGAAWYNDSIATAPERAIAAIQAFDEPLVLLLGGRDKKLPWERIAGLIHQRVDHVIAFGEAADLILNAVGPIQPGDRLQTIHHSPGLQSAVQIAADVVKTGDVVLLSPGGTSFDEFEDFEERGERFREWVKALS